MMKLGIMQPYFLPYIGYFQLINAVDEYVIYDDVNYIKRGWINRNKMLLNGNDFLFTINLVDASQNKLINEVELSDNQPKLLKTIEAAYKKAPFFSDVFPMIDEIVCYENKNLAKYTANSVIKVCKYLEMNTKFIFSSDIKEKNNSLKCQEKIIEICNILQAKQYINAIGGMELYDRALFERIGIDLHFLKPKPIEYKQFGHPFVCNLSILDVLMFNSVEQIRTFLLQYELV